MSALIVSLGLPPAGVGPNTDDALARGRMVQLHIAARGIRDPLVLGAMGRVKRHAFVPARLRHLAYADRPLPIGHDQTISQPYIVALMTTLAGAKPGAKVLDVGTGSGYQAAVLAEIVGHVYGIEIICPLADTARQRLTALGYQNVTIRCGDGYRGWPEHAPFDLIILAAAPEKVPQPLLDQLTTGGRLVLPVGDRRQRLVVYERGANGEITKTDHGAVRFVPMTGESQVRVISSPPEGAAPPREK
jgi:protein-L-isoaspartate(D-aspartate) O-methyltransferase